MRELRTTLTILLLTPLIACGIAGLTPLNPNGCLAGVPECARTTRGIEGFAASALVNPDATPLLARIRVGETVNLQIHFSAGLTGCGERSWSSVTWVSTDPGVATAVAGPTDTFAGVGIVTSGGVLIGVAPGTTQILAILHFDQACYPARDEQVQLIVSPGPRTIDAVMVVPN